MLAAVAVGYLSGEVVALAEDLADDLLTEGGEALAVVLSKDADEGGGALTVTAVDGSAEGVGAALAGRRGTLTLQADGSYVYVADQAQRWPRAKSRSTASPTASTTASAARRRRRWRSRSLASTRPLAGRALRIGIWATRW